MQSDELSLELDALYEKYGRAVVQKRISTSSRNGDKVLSILADAGMHRQPDDLLLGKVHHFSKGMIDTSTDETVSAHVLDCCTQLVTVLKEDEWSEIRLFFSGHSLLPAYAKLTVYRVTHLDTVDFGFFGEAGFKKLTLSLRRHIIA